MDSTKMVSKILEWVDENKRVQDGGYGDLMVEADSLCDFLKSFITPTKKLVWHMRTKDNQEWRPIAADEYEVAQHLSRFEFKQFMI